MNIDRIDPWSGRQTNVPFYSTYLSFPWLTVKLKSHLYSGFGDGDNGGRNSNNRGALSVNQQIDFVMTATFSVIAIGDYFAPHGLVQLVEQHKRDYYISALEEHYQKYNKFMDKAIWFKGQQIEIDIHGRIAGEVR